MKVLLCFLVVVSVLVGTQAIIDDKLISNYGQTQLKKNCFGERAYVQYMAKLRQAETTCKSKNFNLQSLDTLHQTTHTSVHNTYAGFQYYNRAKVNDLSLKMRSRVATSICVLQQLGYLDKNNRISYETMIKEIQDIGRMDRTLKEDLISSIKDCKAMAECTPVNNILAPMIAETFRFRVFHNCREHANTFACLKKDLRSRRYEFELTASEDDMEAPAADDQMLAIMWGEATLGSFELN